MAASKQLGLPIKERKKPRIVRYPKPKVDPDRVDLDEASATELVLICRRQGIVDACRGVPRDVLIESLYALEPLPVEDPLRQIRSEVAAWLERYWGKFMQQSSELPPELLKPTDLLDLNIVTDAEVMDLWLENKELMDAW